MSIITLSNILSAGPFSSFPSIKKLSELQVNKWYEMGLHLGVTKDEMERLRISRHPTTLTFLAAKTKNMELRWKDILQALLSVEEYELADHVCTKQGAWVITIAKDKHLSFLYIYSTNNFVYLFY